MKHATLMMTLAVMVCNPLLLLSLENGDSLANILSSAKSAGMSVPEAAPAGVKTPMPAKSTDISNDDDNVMDRYDAEKGAKLADCAEENHKGGSGACYEAVSWAMNCADILRRPDKNHDDDDWIAMGIMPDYSEHAYQFAEWASKNREKMRREIKLDVMPTPHSRDGLPIGSIVVYDRGTCGFSSKSGHIEVVTAPNRACSDICERFESPSGGDCFADPDIREHIHVYIPVKE
jgi:hypothetical protein